MLFDLDGTLYRQRRMRMLMALELSTLFATQPGSARRRLRALAAYRKAQEALRLSEVPEISPTTQIERAAVESGLTTEEIEAIVSEWMFERPLKYLPWCRAAGLSELLLCLGRQGLEVGVLSDYPAEAKLRALGLAGRFSPVLCSSDPEVRALKPHPRGFLRACRHWRIEPREVLVVGDRVDVDGRGAMAAGMPCVIVGRSSVAADVHSGVRFVSSLERLRCVLDDGR